MCFIVHYHVVHRSSAPQLTFYFDNYCLFDLIILLCVCACTYLKGGKTKILFPIYYEEARPPTAGVPESVIEKEQVREEGDGGGGESGTVDKTPNNWGT